MIVNVTKLAPVSPENTLVLDQLSEEGVLGLVVGSEREVLFVFSEEDGVTYVCLRCSVSSLSVVRSSLSL